MHLCHRDMWTFSHDGEWERIFLAVNEDKGEGLEG